MKKINKERTKGMKKEKEKKENIKNKNEYEQVIILKDKVYKVIVKRLIGCWAFVVHAFNPNTREAEAG